MLNSIAGALRHRRESQIVLIAQIHLVLHRVAELVDTLGRRAPGVDVIALVAEIAPDQKVPREAR